MSQFKSKSHLAAIKANFHTLKFAAVDIGSNAIRMQVSSVISFQDHVNLKKLEYIRFPLRLGQDVFVNEEISPANQARFIKLMNAFRLLIELYEVDDFMICATSAMREARNGREVVSKVKEEQGMDIKIINGDEEAYLINNAITGFMDEKTYLHIDVGGGSTEINLYVNRVKVNSRSFRIGSVRRLQHLDSPGVWDKMQQWVVRNTQAYRGIITAVGTGGNIVKIFELANKKPGKTLSLVKGLEIKKALESMTIEDRIQELALNPDRADVILPASEIYFSIMRWANARQILVPNVGLKEGIIKNLFEKRSDGRPVQFS